MVHPDQQYSAHTLRLAELREQARPSRPGAPSPDRLRPVTLSPRRWPGAFLATLLARLARRARRGEQPP